MLPLNGLSEKVGSVSRVGLLLAFGLSFGACQAGAQEEAGELSVRVVEAFPELKFERPLYFSMAPDGTDRVFVLEQGGRVVWFENRPDIAREEVRVALDITDKVRSPVSEVRRNRGHNEEGLLGMAFHPNFAENRFVFLHYSATNPPGSEEARRGVIARFRMDEEAETIDPASETTILEVGQFAGNHNGGMIAFGPDGYLYIAFGDGGGAGDPQKNGQDLSTLLGAILRIDVDRKEDGLAYAIPDDNPFVDRDGARAEIFAYGLRNPWRFSFDPATGDLWVGDVCQGSWEKIYLIRNGGNYGWPWMEGSHPHDGIPDGVDPAGLTPPIHEHPRSEARSITGGQLYRGEAIPELKGAFVYGDFVTGLLFALWYDREAGEVIRRETIGRSAAISSFGVDLGGEIHVVSLDGSLYKLAPL